MRQRKKAKYDLTNNNSWMTEAKNILRMEENRKGCRIRQHFSWIEEWNWITECFCLHPSLSGLDVFPSVVQRPALMAGPGVSSLYNLRAGACWRQHTEDRSQVLSRVTQVLWRLRQVLSRSNPRSPHRSTSNTLMKPATRDLRRCSAPRMRTTS